MRLKALAATLAVLAAGVFAGGVLATPQTHHIRRGHSKVVHPQAGVMTRTSHPVVAFTQEFQTNANGFCQPASGVAPCDGAEGDYGTIDRVASGFSNGGRDNYAPFTKALVGSWMALTSGSQAMNEGAGCPNTTISEYCTGPYAFFSGGHDNVFPTGGFTVTDDLYLSSSTAPTDGQIDDDVGLNTSSGTYGRDNVISACPISGGYAISFGNQSPGTCGTTANITSDGWYRFVFIFADVNGDAYLTEKVLSESTGAVLANSGRQPVELPGGTTGLPISDWGGPGYFWLPTENVSGVPFANFAVQLGEFSHGHTP